MLSEDKIIGSSSEWFTSPPEDQTKEQTKEKNSVLRELPKIKAILERLRERAAHYGDVTAIPSDIRLDKEKLAIRIDAMAETKANLEAEIGLLESMIVEHTEN